MGIKIGMQSNCFSRPAISVVTSVYNHAPYLASAIRSVLNQSFADFEWILIDDDSSDESIKIISQFNDPRLKLVKNPVNLQLPRALNHGFSLAQGKYIVRFDSDDICEPDRFMQQFAFMEANPSIDICGSAMRYLGARLRHVTKPSPEPAVNRCLSLFVNPVYHPTIILRRARFEELGMRYDPEALYAEDYDLWLRHSLDLRIGNLPRPLLRYRIHGSQVTKVCRARSDQSVMRAQRMFFEKNGLKPTQEQLAMHFAFSRCRAIDGKGFSGNFIDWVEMLVAWNRERRIYPSALFEHILLDRWVRVAGRLPRRSSVKLRDIWQSSLGRRSTLSIKRRIKYYIHRLATAS